MTNRPDRAFRGEQWTSLVQLVVLMAFLGTIAVGLGTWLLDVLGVDSLAWVRRHPLGVLAWAVSASVLAALLARDGIAQRWRHLPVEERARWEETDG